MNETLAILIGQLDHTDRNIRARAAVDLGTLGDTSVTAVLVQALVRERELFVREYITWALVRMGDTAVASLVLLLSDPDSRVRHCAVHALSKIGDPRAIGALIAALHDDDLSVVTKAAYALGESASATAIPALVGLLGREERELQATLVLALERFGRARSLRSCVARP